MLCAFLAVVDFFDRIISESFKVKPNYSKMTIKAKNRRSVIKKIRTEMVPQYFQGTQNEQEWKSVKIITTNILI